MENIRFAQVDVRPGDVDFHRSVRDWHGRCARIHINDRLVIGVVDKPADAVRVDGRSTAVMFP